MANAIADDLGEATTCSEGIKSNSGNSMLICNLFQNQNYTKVMNSVSQVVNFTYIQLDSVQSGSSKEKDSVGYMYTPHTHTKKKSICNSHIHTQHICNTHIQHTQHIHIRDLELQDFKFPYETHKIPIVLSKPMKEYCGNGPGIST